MYTHTNKWPFRCPIPTCQNRKKGKGFPDSYEMERHLAKSHKTELTYDQLVVKYPQSNDDDDENTSENATSSAPPSPTSASASGSPSKSTDKEPNSPSPPPPPPTTSPASSPKPKPKAKQRKAEKNKQEFVHVYEASGEKVACKVKDGRYFRDVFSKGL